MKHPGREDIRLFLIGAGMGAANVIPGVSGGTIAFITGIFNRLVASLRSFNASLLRRLLRGNFRKAFRHVDGAFLLPLGIGVVVSILSLAKLAKYLLAEHPVCTWAFFFGLILASIFRVGGKIGKWGPATGVALTISTVATYILVGLMPARTPEELWFIFVSGALAISAMILPGLSGSYILIVLGKYQYMLSALLEPEVPVVLVFLAGCAAGLVLFSHALHWLLKRHAAVTTAVLTGLMAGSLRKVWPWKETLLSIKGRGGRLIATAQENVMPDWGSELGLALVFAAVGAAIVLLLGEAKKRGARR